MKQLPINDDRSVVLPELSITPIMLEQAEEEATLKHIREQFFSEIMIRKEDLTNDKNAWTNLRKRYRSL